RRRDHTRLLAVLGEELGGGLVIGIADRAGEGLDVLAILVRQCGLAADSIAHALGDACRDDRIGRDAGAAQLLAPHEAEAVTPCALLTRFALGRALSRALGGCLLCRRGGGRCRRARRGRRSGGGLLRR